MRDVVKKLVNIYHNEEYWHDKKLSQKDAEGYFKKLLETKAILYLEQKGELVGYMEVWLLDKDQAEKVMSGLSFSPMGEDVFHGEYAYVANIYIDPGYRRRSLIKQLWRFFEEVHGTDYRYIIYKKNTRMKGEWKINKRR